MNKPKDLFGSPGRSRRGDGPMNAASGLTPRRLNLDQDEFQRLAVAPSEKGQDKTIYTRTVSPLGRNSTGVTSPDCVVQSEINFQNKDPNEKDDAIAAKVTYLNVDQDETCCSVRDIRYKQIHEMSKQCEYLLRDVVVQWSSPIRFLLCSREYTINTCINVDVEILLRTPNLISQYSPHGRRMLFQMSNDLEDDAFQFPGFNVGARLIPPRSTVRFSCSSNLRIGIILSADSCKGVRFVLGRDENVTAFRLGEGDHFLVPTDEKGPADLINRSRCTFCTVIIITIIAKPPPASSTIAKPSIEEKELDYSSGKSYNGKWMSIRHLSASVNRILTAPTFSVLPSGRVTQWKRRG